MGLADLLGEFDQGRGEIPVHHRDAEQLAELAGHDAERDAAEEPDQDRAGEEVDDEAHARHAADDHDHACSDRQGCRQLQVEHQVAVGHRHQQRCDHGAGGGVGTDHQLPRGAEQGVDQYRQHAGIEADLGREAGQRGVGDRRRDLHRGHRQPGDDVTRQPRLAVVAEVAQQGDPIGQHVSCLLMIRACGGRAIIGFSAS
jgi:hypothetical protein